GQLQLRSRCAGRHRGGGQCPELRPTSRRLGRRRPARELLLQAGIPMTRLSGPAMLLTGFLAGLATPLLAQDTTRAVHQGVPPRLDYAPGTQPGLVVLPASGLDSARAIVERDLDYSDRFQIVQIGSENGVGAGGRGGSESGGISYGIYKALGAEFGVELTAAAGGGGAGRLHDVMAGEGPEQQKPLPPPPPPRAHPL